MSDSLLFDMCFIGVLTIYAMAGAIGTWLLRPTRRKQAHAQQPTPERKQAGADATHDARRRPPAM